VGGDGGEIPAGRGTGDRCRGRLQAQLLQRAQRQRQEGGARLRLGDAGRLPECAGRLGEERHLGAGRKDRGRMIEGPRAIGGEERRHPQPDRELREVGGGFGVAPRNAGGIAAKAVSVRPRKGTERMQRSRPRALSPG
jgi:hypothetical protein